jgi:hypothetical protein
MYPSSIVFALSGFIILYVIFNLVSDQLSGAGTLTLLKSSQINTFLLTLAIALGIHGLCHAYAEVNYGFNPFEGKWNYRIINKK